MESVNDIGTIKSIFAKVREWKRGDRITIKLVFCKGDGCDGLKWLTNDLGSDWLLGCNDPICMQSFNEYIGAARKGLGYGID